LISLQFHHDSIFRTGSPSRSPATCQINNESLL
jgi:hypothetical protein